MKLFLILVALLLRGISAFTVYGPRTGPRIGTLRETDKADEPEDDVKNAKLEVFLEKKFPSFHGFLNDSMRKAIKEGSVTIFAPNEAAFEALGKKRLVQIEDPRNLETREKMGSYHVIPQQTISAIELKTEDWTKGRPKDGSKPNTLVAAVKTLAGEVPVGRRYDWILSLSLSLCVCVCVCVCVFLVKIMT